MFVIVVLFVLLTDVSGYYLANLILPPNPHKEQQYTYEKCLSMRKILYKGQCWDLLTKGPCDEGQWLVLNWDDEMDGRDEQPLTGKCTRRRCSESDLYWPRDGFCYDAVSARHRRLCPSPDTELTTDEFGDGYCECRTGGSAPYVRAVTDDGDENSRPCYPVYSKGPCPSGQVLTPYGWRYGNCTADQCAAERDDGGYERQSVAMAPWTDGRCYGLGTRGPCASNEQFAVIRDGMQPDCVRTATELDLFSNKKSTAAEPPHTQTPPCKTDHRGACVDGVDVLTDDPSFGFKTQLLASAKRHASRDRRKKKRTP